MSGLNRVECIGNLVARADLRYTQSSQPVTSFRVAANETYFSGGEKKKRVEYISCVLWGKRGEALSRKECLEQGQSLYVSGRLQTRKWTDKDNNVRYTTEVVVGNNDSDLLLLGRRTQSGGNQQEEAPAPTDEDVPQETSTVAAFLATEDFSE